MAASDTFVSFGPPVRDGDDGLDAAALAVAHLEAVLPAVELREALARVAQADAARVLDAPAALQAGPVVRDLQ